MITQRFIRRNDMFVKEGQVKKGRKFNLGVIAFLLVAVLVVALVGCTQQEPEPTKPAEPTEPAEKPPQMLKIGVMHPLSGPAALWGTAVEDMLGRYYDMRNAADGITVAGQKYKIDFISIDDKYSAEGGRAAAETMFYEKNVKLITGNLAPPAIAAWAGIASKEKIVALVGGGGVVVKPEFPYLFQCTPSVTQRLYCSIAAVQKDNPGLKKVAFLLPDDLTGHQCEEAAPALMEKLGLEITTITFHPRGTKDYYAHLTSVLATKPEVIWGVSSPGDEALIVKQSREMGFKGQLAWPSTVLDIPGFLKIAGHDAAQGMYLWYDDYVTPTAADKGAAAKMTEYFNYSVKVAGIDPEGTIGLAGYLATAEAMLQALEKANSLDPDKIVETLHSAKFDCMMGSGLSFGGEQTYGVPNRLNGYVGIGKIQGEKAVGVANTLYVEP